jgi:hypothetical protein
MNGISRTRQRRGAPAGHNRPLPHDDPPGTWAENGPGADSISADMRAVAGPDSFWRITRIPFTAWLTALERWQLTGHGSELRLGQSLLRGPTEHDPHLGTCRIEVRLARGPLRPPLRMRLDIDHWSATSTALTLIPCQRVRPGTAYFQAGRRLLDFLTREVPTHPPAQRPLGRASTCQPPAHDGSRPAGVSRESRTLPDLRQLLAGQHVSVAVRAAQ